MANPKNFTPARAPYKARQPKSIESILGNTARSLGIATKLRSYEAFPQWPEIVGDTVAKVARPEKISHGNLLVVKVIDTAWAQELSMQKETILQKIHQHGKGAHIDDIRFIVGSPRDFKENS